MKAKKLLVASFFAGVLAVGAGALALAPKSEAIKSKAVIARCASIHFGMNDSTLVAKVFDVGTEVTALSTFNNVSTVSGIEINSATLSKVYCKSGKALKIGASSYTAELTLTFKTEITAVTIYALGYKTDTSELTVNGVKKTLTTNIETVQQAEANATNETFEPYLWEFDDPTDTLTITTAKKSRAFIADIAIRNQQ